MDEATAVRTQPARIAAGAQTNVPRWPATVPRLGAGARRWLVVDLGAARVAQSWLDRAGDVPTEHLDVRPLAADARDDQLAALADRIAAEAKVGLRVAVCGPEADVMVVRAGLVAGGFLDEEVLTHATSTHEIRVRCAHCAAITRHRARPGDVVACLDCGFDEVVHHHFSRRLAAYLAFRVDAEAGPADAVVQVSGEHG